MPKAEGALPTFHVEMRWRCSACKTEVLGRLKACGSCGKPKGSESFYDADEQPPTVQASVTDPRLIALATAGADWTCPFCQNRQSRLLTACSGCGGVPSEAGGDHEVRADVPSAHASIDGSRALWEYLLILLGTVCVLVFVVPRVLHVLRGEEVTGLVKGRSWKHTIVVERYQIVEGSGFAETQPASAFQLSEDGSRHHHYRQVPDGTTRESYTERVACGQTCTKTRVSCRSNDNGFKTCTGGDRVCSTRYCNEVRYRTVPRFKSVSVLAPWYKWRSWEWKFARTLETHGSSDTPSWPNDAEVALEVGCGAGEKERLTREAAYEIWFETSKDNRVVWKTRDLQQFLELRLGVAKRLHVDRFRGVQLLADPPSSGAVVSGAESAAPIEQLDGFKSEERRL